MQVNTAITAHLPKMSHYFKENQIVKLPPHTHLFKLYRKARKGTRGWLIAL